jgi:hypothetical protein
MIEHYVQQQGKLAGANNSTPSDAALLTARSFIFRAFRGELQA